MLNPGFQHLVSQLDRAIAQGVHSSDTIRDFLRQALGIVARSTDREETTLAFSQKTVQLLFKSSSQVGREIYVLLLQRLCESSTRVAKEAIEWLLFADDEVNPNSIPTLIITYRRIIQ